LLIERRSTSGIGIRADFTGITLGTANCLPGVGGDLRGILAQKVRGTGCLAGITVLEKWLRGGQYLSVEKENESKNLEDRDHHLLII
jgi:hypothetical protein